MKIHFIAIAGSAMHNLALALQAQGHKITGSDDAFYEPAKSKLLNNGLLPEKEGWFSEKVTSAIDAVILGMHAKVDNPELLKAQELGLKVYSYPEFIYEHSKDKTRVVIGGSHGKTTITSMILHVLHYHQKEVDFLVGAQLEGFDTMVHLSHSSDFIIIEGDEYLASPIDRRPKFHIYQPNIALISGISWDHINVFPTFENYIEQFKIFIEKITNGGILVYNQEDTTVNSIVEESENPIRKLPYHLPKHRIENGITYLETANGKLPLEIFGTHNLSNLAGAQWICQNIGIDIEDFYEAIASFKGASKRLEKLKETENYIVFKDFAHSPSKVQATVKAVKEQFPSRFLCACLELHTFSSLTPEFLKQYKNTLNKADQAFVFYSPEAIKTKGLAFLSKEEIAQAFGHQNLHVFTSSADLKNCLLQSSKENRVMLFMSSGNYDGLNLNEII